MRLVDILPTDASAALTQAQLAARLYGVPEREGDDAITNTRRRSAIRKVQEEIAALRDVGVPVCTDERGVWRAVTESDAALAYRQLRGRVHEQLRTVSAQKRAWQRIRRETLSIEQETLPWVA